jgi:hypothetical protein
MVIKVAKCKKKLYFDFHTKYEFTTTVLITKMQKKQNMAGNMSNYSNFFKTVLGPQN